MDLPDSDRGDFSCRRAVDSSSYIYPLINNCCGAKMDVHAKKDARLSFSLWSHHRIIMTFQE